MRDSLGTPDDESLQDDDSHRVTTSFCTIVSNQTSALKFKESNELYEATNAHTSGVKHSHVKPKGAVPKSGRKINDPVAGRAGCRGPKAA